MSDETPAAAQRPAGGPAGGDEPSAAPGDPTDPAADDAAADVHEGDEKPKRKKRGGAVREVVIILAVALLVSALVRAFLFQAFYIPSGSMENTLLVNDRVIVSKIGQQLDDPNRGDVVVFRDPGGWVSARPQSDSAPGRAIRRGFEIVGLAPSAADQDVIKRVIGVGGDRVACCDAQGRVTVNGVPLEESSYLFPGDVPSSIKFDVLVPEGRIFVMGDHRSDSGDSRVHLSDEGNGTVSLDRVIGRAVLLVWPLSRWQTIGVPETFKNPEIDARRGAAAAP